MEAALPLPGGLQQRHIDIVIHGPGLRIWIYECYDILVEEMQLFPCRKNPRMGTEDVISV